MLRLNEAFGIGFIQLNPENVKNSKILFPSRYRENLDWKTIDNLAKINKDFKKFLTSVTADIKGSKLHPSDYDKVYSAKEIEKIIEEKGIH